MLVVALSSEENNERPGFSSGHKVDEDFDLIDELISDTFAAEMPELIVCVGASSDIGVGVMLIFILADVKVMRVLVDIPDLSEFFGGARSDVGI